MNTLKTGGRQKGSLNRTTKEIREGLQVVINAELDHLPNNLSQMAMDKRFDFLFRLLAFVLTKLNPVDPEQVIREEEDGMWQMAQRHFE